MKAYQSIFNCFLLNKKYCYPSVAIFLIGLIFPIHCFTQYQNNLVPNYSFELHYLSCNNFEVGEGATDWISPVLNSMDYYAYFNTCATQQCCTVPASNFNYFYQYPHSGNAYVGFLAMSNYSDNIRNYVQVKLLDTLRANHSYYIEFYLNLSNFETYATNNVALLLGDTAIKNSYDRYTPASPQILQYGNPVISDTLNWVKVGGVYKAHGGEQYITIGNFSDDAHTDTIHFQTVANEGAGYNLDDVSVYDLDSFNLKAYAGRDTTIYKGDSAWIGTRLCGLTNVVWYDSAGGTKDTFAANVPGMWVKPTASNYYIITQTVNGFYSTDTVWVTVVQAVPVTITNYEASPTPPKEGLTGMGVLNSWISVNEVNLSHYNVQRSLDGKVFETVGVVKAKGSGKYSFLDAAPLSKGEGLGVRFYRLQMVDKDGSFSYSKVLSVSLSTNNYQLSIIPNPARDYFTVESSNLKEVQVIDLLGRVVIDKKVVGNSTSISLRDVSSGLYLVKGINGDNNIETGKLIKQ